MIKSLKKNHRKKKVKTERDPVSPRKGHECEWEISSWKSQRPEGSGTFFNIWWLQQSRGLCARERSERGEGGFCATQCGGTLVPWTDYCVCTRVCAERGSQLTEVDSDALSSPSSGILTDIQVPDAVARERTSTTWALIIRSCCRCEWRVHTSEKAKNENPWPNFTFSVIRWDSLQTW